MVAVSEVSGAGASGFPPKGLWGILLMPGEASVPHTRFMDTTSVYEAHVTALTESLGFRQFESGRLTKDQYDRFILNVGRTHTKSPQLLAFLFSMAPPAAAASIRGNMLEELGVADELGQAHPALLEQLLHGAGLAHRSADIRGLAEMDMRRLVTESLLYESLAQVGLAAMIEVTAFEYMLSRVADRMATALATHRGLSAHAIEWFTHHGSVDIGHAATGVRNIETYVEYYAIDDHDATTILEIAMRENAFIKRYFADVTTALVATTLVIEPAR
ncbi:MAG: iron-containing redox enzyme family protein [Acidimicrobiales bacterium]